MLVEHIKASPQLSSWSGSVFAGDRQSARQCLLSRSTAHSRPRSRAFAFERNISLEHSAAQKSLPLSDLQQALVNTEEIPSTLILWAIKSDLGKCFEGDATDRKFNRMRPSMARVLGLETRSAKEG